MNGRDEFDPEEGVLGAQLRAGIDAQLERARVAPDPEAMLARAQELRSEAREDADLEESRDRASLRPFVLAYLDWLDARLVDVEPGVAPAGRRRGRWLAPALALAAALALVWFGLGQIRGARAVSENDLGAQGRQAAHQADLATTGGSAQARAEEAPRSRKPRPSKRRASVPEPSLEPPAQVVPATPLPVGSAVNVARELVAGYRARAEAMTPPPSRASIEDRLDRLDRDAQALWRAGKLAKAERKYREIVRIAGKRKAAQVAYAELFSLARQQGRVPTKEWAAYLKKFPRGRYAEDAQAGLCRRAKGAERDRCWKAYRSKFPNGIHGP